MEIADGTFVYTGFKPAFVMIKNCNHGENNNWNMIDNKRPGYNEMIDHYFQILRSRTRWNLMYNRYSF